MRKKLLILNYQREVPPFLQTQVKFAKDFFDDIYYVTPKLYNDNTETICYENVRVVIIKKQLEYGHTYVRLLEYGLIILSGENFSEAMRWENLQLFALNIFLL